jgi:putative tryptophan/tyrosine transport system substrate-binding protein
VGSAEIRQSWPVFVAGLVASFNRPGGNLIGVTVFSVALELKRLVLLRELIALLVNPNNLTATAARRELNNVTRRIGQDVLILDAGTEGKFEAVFATLTQ